MTHPPRRHPITHAQFTLGDHLPDAPATPPVRTPRSPKTDPHAAHRAITGPGTTGTTAARGEPTLGGAAPASDGSHSATIAARPNATATSTTYSGAGARTGATPDAACAAFATRIAAHAPVPTSKPATLHAQASREVRTREGLGR